MVIEKVWPVWWLYYEFECVYYALVLSNGHMVEWTKRATAAAVTTTENNLNCEYKRQEECGCAIKRMAGRKRMGIDSMEQILQMFCYGRTMHKQIEKKNVKWQNGTMLTERYYFFRNASYIFPPPSMNGKHAWALWGTLIDLSAIFWNHQTQPVRWYCFFTDLQLTKRFMLVSVWVCVCMRANLTDNKNNNNNNKKETVLLTTNQIR